MRLLACFFACLAMTLMIGCATMETLSPNNDYAGPREDFHPLLQKEYSGLGLQLHIHHNADWALQEIRELSPDLMRQDLFVCDHPAYNAPAPEDYYDVFVDMAEEFDGAIIFIMKGPWESNESIECQLPVVDRYRGRPVIWELGNEPNDHISPKQYASWAREAAAAIRSVDPDACIIGPASEGMTDDDIEWTLESVESGILEFLDGYSVHFYWKTMDDARPAMRRLKNAIESNRPQNRPMPVVISEGGARGDIPSDGNGRWKMVKERAEFLDEEGFDTFVWYALEGKAKIQVFQDPVRPYFVEYWRDWRESRDE